MERPIKPYDWSAAPEQPAAEPKGQEGLSHDDAITAICNCAATVTVLSYQEAIEGYFKLRGLGIPAAPSPNSALREVYARIIEPDEWLAIDRAGRAFDFPTARAQLIERHCKRSLAKADECLAASLSVGVVEPKVFLDCDGVLADFDAHGLAYFGTPPRQAEAELGAQEFWRQLEAKGDFYRSMPVMAGAYELFDAVKHLHPTILTGCPRGDWAQGQKVAWAAEHFPGVPIITCRSADKRDYAKPGDVLIDDWPQHRHRWIEMGGHFILHLDAASSIAALWAHYPALATGQGDGG